MRLGIPYLILLFFSLVISKGNADAHPHKLGNLNHGPSLESYLTGLDFTIDDSTKGKHAPNIEIARKNKASIKKQTGAHNEKFDKKKIKKEKGTSNK